MKNLTRLVTVVFFCSFSSFVWAQVTGDFRTISTTIFAGNWNDTNSWERYNGATWDDPGTGSNSPALIPADTNSVWVQTGAIITLTQDGSCKDLHICTNNSGSTPSSTAMGKIDLQENTLNITGKLRCYTGALASIPGTSTSVGFARFPFTGTTGKVSIIGDTRNLMNTGEWSAIIQSQTGIFPLEINLSTGQTLTIATGLMCTSLNVVSSGNAVFLGNTTVTGTIALGNDTIDIGGTTLHINEDFTAGTGVIRSNGKGSVLIGGTGPLSNALSFDQTIPGITNRVRNLTINRTSSGSVTLGNTIEVTGTVTLTNGTLNAGGFLTLVSNASGTARVASIPATADISGDVKVQRYVPAVARRNRMFSPNTSGFIFSDMIDNIFVTGPGGTVNGFDASVTNSPSIYTYQEDTTGGRGWKAVTGISQYLPEANGAMVLVRGDRTLSGWNTPPFPAQNEVTVDFNGAINKGTITPTITYSNTGKAGLDGWNLIGNPYPSQIDWSALTKSNLDANYYILDPSTGSYVSDNGSNYIASGQAFFVQAIGALPTITFTESAKVGTTPVNYFKTGLSQIQIKMVKDSLNSDIAWLEFNSSSSKGFSRGEDALKFTNSVINFGFYIDSVITIQRNSVPMPLIADTFIMSAYAAAGTYTLQFANMSSSLPSSKNIYLKDLFNSNIINLRNTSTYTFSISSSPASSGNRFQLIINDPSMLPVKLVEFYAEKDSKEKDVILHWSSSSEKNSDRFIIERSTNNTNDFTEIGIVAAKSNSQTILNYQFNDQDILGKNAQTIFYRLKQVDKDGSYQYSKIVSINNEPASVEIRLAAYPNPTSGILTVEVSGAKESVYLIEAIDIVGKVSKKMIIKNHKEQIDLSDLTTGVYTLKFTTPTGSATTFIKVVIE